MFHVFPLQFTLPDPARIAVTTWPAAEPVHVREVPPTVSFKVVIEGLTVLSKKFFQLLHCEAEHESVPVGMVS